MFTLRRRFLIGIVLIFVVASIILIRASVDRSDIRQSFRIYTDARLKFEEVGTYGGGITETSVYYWSPSAVSSVLQYYSELSLNFRKGNTDTKWLITAYISDTWQPKEFISITTVLTHSNFCDPFGPYNCVSISLFDIADGMSSGLLAVSPHQFKEQNMKLDNKLGTLPKYGTLIVYTYYQRS